MRRILPRDANDVQVQLAESGAAPIDTPFVFLKTEELKNTPKALKLSSCVFAIEAGCTVYLWWHDKGGDSLILPLEGRGTLNFDPFGGISNPRNEGWTGHVQLTTKHTVPGPKSFFIGLEFAKIRE